MDQHGLDGALDLKEDSKSGARMVGDGAVILSPASSSSSLAARLALDSLVSDSTGVDDSSNR